MLPLTLEHEYRTIARASALSYAAISTDEARRLAVAVRDRYRVDIDHTARAIACLATLAFGEAGEVRRDYIAAMRGDIGKEFDVGTTELGLAYYQSDADSLKRDGTFGLGINDVDAVLKSIAVILAMLVGESVARDVLSGARKYAQLQKDAEIEAWADVALEAILPTDIPPRPTTEPSPPANDSQGTIDDEQPVLVYRDATRLFELLHQAQVQAVSAARRHEGKRFGHVSGNAGDVVHGSERLAREAHAEALAYAKAQELLIEAIPALHSVLDTMTPDGLTLIGPKSDRNRPAAGARPREFAWGAPAVHGMIPTIFDHQDALEVHVVIPEECRIHPAYESAGREVDDRVGALISRMIDRNPAATHATIRIELFNAAFRPCTRPLDSSPLASETTSAGFSTIPCPFCGASQELSKPAEDPALYAGDPIEHVCTACGRSSTLRIEDAARIYMRTGYKSEPPESG